MSAPRLFDDEIKRLPGFALLLTSDRLCVWGAGPHLKLHDRQGVILGRVFAKSSASTAMKRFSATMSEAISQSDGQSLIERCWGAYVAVIAKPSTGEVTVLRDPSYGQPCYQIACDDFTAYVSDVETAMAAKLIRPVFEWSAIAYDLAYPTIKSTATGLWKVREVLPGTAIIDGPKSQAIRTSWQPWPFTQKSLQFQDRSEAVAALKTSVLATTRTLTSTFSRGLIETSGGLDSSILAAAFDEAGAHLSGINLLSGDGAGNETDYATLLTEALNIPLASCDLAPVFPVMPLRTFRPAVDILQAANDAAIMAHARLSTPDAFISGAGGDNVFCFIKTAVPAADALRGAGVGAFAHALHNLSILHNCTLWKAGHLSFKSLNNPPAGYPPIDRTFMTGNYLAPTSFGHPWLPVVGRPLSGKIRHVLSLMSAQRFSDNLTRNGVAPVLFPLLCQPVIETALRIPTWMWIEGGRDRACARDAFCGHLPDAILTRRSKGNFMMFYARAFEHHKKALQEQLNYGLLSRAGIIDRTAINAFMGKPLMSRDATFLRLFQFAKVEAWMAAWADVTAKAD